MAEAWRRRADTSISKLQALSSNLASLKPRHLARLLVSGAVLSGWRCPPQVCCQELSGLLAHGSGRWPLVVNFWRGTWQREDAVSRRRENAFSRGVDMHVRAAQKYTFARRRSDNFAVAKFIFANV